MHRRQSAKWVATALLVAACGGASYREEEEDGSEAGRGGSNAGSAGSGAGRGGSSAGGGGNDAGRGGGGSGRGGSNAGRGGDDPVATCLYNGTEYPVGATFAAGDGCNTCSCTPDGVGCTQIACNRCLTIENQYATAMSAAKACNPELSVEQCTKPSAIGLACGCTTFVNPANADAEARLRELETEYAESNCGSGIVCGACAEPVTAFCSSEGICQDFYGDDTGAGGMGGFGGAAGVAGEGGAAAVLESCPEARPMTGAPCTGTFTCNYDDTCSCGVCCYSS
ncbi:MAG TPA: hypothetical protein VGK73_22200, partial [Polyangiaceae bacterium]